jgi:hypothetical protein
MSIRCYRDLDVWNFGIKLTKLIYELTRSFPKYEVYGLCNQMQRAAVSIPANIAEGHARCTIFHKVISSSYFHRSWLAGGTGNYADHCRGTQVLSAACKFQRAAIVRSNQPHDGRSATPS